MLDSFANWFTSFGSPKEDKKIPLFQQYSQRTSPFFPSNKTFTKGDVSAVQNFIKSSPGYGSWDPTTRTQMFDVAYNNVKDLRSNPQTYAVAFANATKGIADNKLYADLTGIVQNLNNDQYRNFLADANINSWDQMHTLRNNPGLLNALVNKYKSPVENKDTIFGIDSGKFQNYLGLGMAGVGLAKDIASTWLGYKNYKETLRNNAFQRALAQRNLTNQVADYNRKLEDKALHAAAWNGTSRDSALASIANKRLSDRI